MPDSNAFDACPSFETAILDSFDGTLSQPDRQRVETHVASCAACRAFWQEQKKVDALLSGGLREPRLASDFKQRLLESAKTAQLESAARTQADVALETAIDQVPAGVRRTLLRGAAFSFLDAMGVLTVAAVVIMLGYDLLTRSALLVGLSSQQASFYGATAIGLGVLLGGIWFAFRERIGAVLEGE